MVCAMQDVNDGLADVLAIRDEGLPVLRLIICVKLGEYHLEHALRTKVLIEVNHEPRGSLSNEAKFTTATTGAISSHSDNIPESVE